MFKIDFIRITFTSFLFSFSFVIIVRLLMWHAAVLEWKFILFVKGLLVVHYKITAVCLRFYDHLLLEWEQLNLNDQ